MKVCAINNFSVYRYNNASKQNENRSNPSFGEIENLGKRVLQASAAELREMAEKYHSLPEGAYEDLLEIQNALGFTKKRETMEAIGRFQRELGRLNSEMDALRKSNSPAAKQQLKALEEKGESGRAEYYSFSLPEEESQVDRDVRESFQREV